MDRKLIKEYGTEILSYRLRTARQKTRMQYEDFDKMLLRLDREQRKLSRQKWNLGWEPLNPPVQKGWKRFFVLREDVAKSKDAEFFENILLRINTVDLSHKKTFLQKRRKWGRKYYVVRPQKLRDFDSWEFRKKDFNERERLYFDVIYQYRKPHEPPAIKYVFREPWRFVLKVEPNIIDKVKIRDNELEAHIRKLGDYFDRNAYNGRRNKLIRGNTYKYYNEWDEIERERNPLKNKPISKILDELYHPGTAHS